MSLEKVTSSNATLSLSGGLARLLVILGLALGLTWVYLTHGLIGGSDAQHYARAVADFILQIRAGVFPVWAGQTELVIFGSNYPLRYAPYLQYLAGAIDLVTGQRLAPFFLVNAALAASITSGFLSCYYCLCALLPRQPWIALSLAFLYISCPGVIGLPYAQDLYMSTAALPFLPIVFLGMIRSCEQSNVSSRLLLASGLAGAWLAHPPLALWTGVIAAATQVARIVRERFSRKLLWLDVSVVGIFFILAGYSFISVSGLASQWWTPHVRTADLLLQVRQAFPGNWLFLPRTVGLENLQIGFSLVGLLLVCSVRLCFGGKQLLQRVIVGCCFVLSALIVPLPFVTSVLWHAVPQVVLDITNIWPMQRLTVVIALCIVFSAGLWARSLTSTSRLFRSGIAAGLLAASGWSAFQAYRLIDGFTHLAPARAEVEWQQLPENLPNSGWTLGLCATAPRYANASVMDPELEFHFLDKSTREIRESATDAIFPGFGPGPRRVTPELAHLFTGAINANPGILDLSPRLTLEPGKRYLLAFDFFPKDYTGLLIIQGLHFYRQYRLPCSGEPRSFGSGPESSRVIPLWTSAKEPIELQIQFIPMAEGRKPSDYVPFARYDLKAYDRADLSVQLESFFPYRAIVKNAESGYLETTRIYMPAYRATVDGKQVPTEVSRDGYVLVPIDPGKHVVTVQYVAPLALVISFWIGVAGWLALCLMALTLKVRRYRNGSSVATV